VKQNDNIKDKLNAIPVFMRSEFIEYIERFVKGRYETGAMESLTDEMNFMAGAMCAATFMTEGPVSKEISRVIPPYWIYNGMAGHSVIKGGEEYWITLGGEE